MWELVKWVMLDVTKVTLVIQFDMLFKGPIMQENSHTKEKIHPFETHMSSIGKGLDTQPGRKEAT